LVSIPEVAKVIYKVLTVLRISFEHFSLKIQYEGRVSLNKYKVFSVTAKAFEGPIIERRNLRVVLTSNQHELL
jgi:hypothetical protein